ncbi:hypothetical protein CFBP6626_26710 (plasmid) [Agrobacterium tumefaciens]|nr:hypothetical protein CFBP6626_26710 [Agrobacterium tumefaciens]
MFRGPYVGDGNYYYRAVDGEAPHTNYVGYAFTPAGAYFVAQHYTSAGSQPISSSCDGKSISQLYAEGRAFNFIGNSGAGGSALGDRITSGTLAVSANSSTAIVSLSTNGTTWGYLGSSQSYLPSVSAAQVSSTVISTTAVQIASSTTVTACTATNAGTLRYNSSNTALELCTGSGWQVMGVGIPAGTISAFASTTCPTGWSEYTPARGRFLRGIDNGAGNDPNGTRVPGGVQNDDFKSHKHDLGRLWSDSTGSPNGLGTANSILRSVATNQDYGTDPRGLGIAVGTGSGGDGYMTDALRDTGGNETRPKNIAVTFCQFNGTSNGWNNPLSGGNTVPGGNTGQIQ